MSQPDFEKNFREQLKERELQPSNDSWDKLQGRLEREANKTVPSKWWLGLAAAVMGAIVVLATLVYGPTNDGPALVETPIEKPQNPSEGNEPQLVHEEVKDDLEKPKSTIGKEAVVSFEEASTKTVAVEEAREASEILSEKPLKLDDELPSRAEAREAIAHLSEELHVEGEVSDAEIDALLAEAIAQVSQDPERKKEVADTEVDALLARAMTEVQGDPNSTRNTALAAEELLWEAETELEHSFREQVLELLKEGFRKTRSAVANRID